MVARLLPVRLWCCAVENRVNMWTWASSFRTSPRSGAKVVAGVEAAALVPQLGLARRRRARRRGPPGAADPRLHGRRRLAGDDDPLAARERLPHAPRRDPRQRRLLARTIDRLEAAPRGLRRGLRRARGDHRPEPRRHLRPRARARAGPTSSAGSSRSAAPTVSQLSAHPFVLAQVALVGALGTGRVPGMFRDELPARRVLRALPRRFRRPTFPPEVGFTALYSQHRRRSSTGTPAWTRPPSRSRCAPRTWGWA